MIVYIILAAFAGLFAWAESGAPDKPCGVGCADANPKTMLPNDT